MINPLFDLFERVYVLNLPHRRDRRKEMAAQLKRAGLALNRAPVALFAAVRPDSADGFPSIGARGCFLSHLGILRDAARAGHRRIAILEDDVDFSTTFDVDGPAAAQTLWHAPWDVFYGGHFLGHDSAAADAAGAPGAVRELAPEVPVATSHFMAFSGRAVVALVGYLEAMLVRPPGDLQGGPMHVDGAYSWFRAAHPEFRTLASTRRLGVQRASRSDIYRLQWFDKAPLVRELAQLLRRQMRRRT